ncbi:hypothetical protein AK812_SmicGene18090 [Symbiodinium microadriaticum]|uniref:Stress-response A/B barrel domain-containing protein n=1 Tax=Symbiodinium microadriaticum TaxID=2951 RepID=A0A1Q9DW58_SYMMI|nr:hypothetical protein AK812_SmicGene18090 [Symbiodinium microadriaticum]
MARAVRHVVMIGVKESAAEEQIMAVKEGLAALKAQFEFGVDLKLPSGKLAAKREVELCGADMPEEG